MPWSSITICLLYPYHDYDIYEGKKCSVNMDIKYCTLSVGRGLQRWDKIIKNGVYT